MDVVTVLTITSALPGLNAIAPARGRALSHGEGPPEREYRSAKHEGSPVSTPPAALDLPERSRAAATDVSATHRCGDRAHRPLRQVRRYERGERLIAAGEPAPGMFVMLKGTVLMSQRDGLGHVVPLGTRGPGQFLAEVATLSGATGAG
jgi:hypothetical protein